MSRRGVIALLACVSAAVAGSAGGAQSKAAPPPLIADLPPLGAAAPRFGDDTSRADVAWAMMGREDRIAPPDAPPRRCVLAEANPAEIVANAAADAQIVIINEAHDHPEHRAFIADVAVRLAALGFHTYASETLIGAPNAAAPRPGDGVYAGEPAYGALLRTLRRQGYSLVAYEDNARDPASDNYITDINRREAKLASNLINGVFRADRDAKVLIHVGYAHNKESIDLAQGGPFRPRAITWLARRLKDILGVDPLTIDQTIFEADRDGVCYTSEGGGPPGVDRDLYVAHAPVRFERNRPVWRRDRGAQFVDAPTRLRRADQRVIVEARPAGDPADATPADRVLIDPGEDIPLLLAPGAYTVRAWTDDNAWTSDVALTVRAPAPPPALRQQQQTSRRKKK